jgi:hypothetical protein
MTKPTYRSFPLCTVIPAHERDARVLAEIDRLAKATGQGRRQIILTILDAALKDVKVNGYEKERCHENKI